MLAVLAGVTGAATPALAGVLVVAAGAGWAIAADAATFAISAVCLWMLRRPARERLVRRGWTRRSPRVGTPSFVYGVWTPLDD